MPPALPWTNCARKFATGVPAETPVEARVEESLIRLERPSLRRVINATGVVLHTNLGRAPLGRTNVLAGYSNLEYDLDAGRRGKRDVHVAMLLDRLLGAPGIAVNNNAAAIFLALNELAAGGEVVVSRGELIEIGDGFRIPDIMARSGAVLREVGTTNRTRIDDYRDGHQRPHAPAAARASQQLPHLGLHRASGTARPGGARARAQICRYTKTWAAGASPTCAPSESTNRWFPTASRPGWIWSLSAATNCWADRRRGFWRGKPRSWRACGVIRCSARYGWTR